MHLAMWPTPCTIGQVHLLVYYIKLKSRLSVRPSVRPSDRHAGNSVVSAWIDVEFDLCEAVVSGMCTHVSISF